MVDGHEKVTDDNIISRIMGKAAVADRRALFAALQAAVAVIIDLHYQPQQDRDPFERVEAAIDLGAEFGSPEHIARAEGRTAT